MAQAKKVHQITDPKQVKSLASAVRLDIVDHLARNGPLAVRELAAKLRLKPSSLYRHIDALITAGLVVETGQRVVNRRTERLYDCVARRILLEKAYRADASKDPLLDVFAALNRQTQRDIGAAIEDKHGNAEGRQRNLGFGRVIGNPSNKDLARINQLLEEISLILRSSSKSNSNTVAFGWSMAPIRDFSDDDSE